MPPRRALRAAPESGGHRCHQGRRGHHRRAVEGGHRRKQRRGTEGARPHAEHQEGRGHGHEARGAHEHDGPRAARRGREGPASAQPGSGGQSEALSAAHRLHGEAGCLHQPDAGAGVVRQHRTLARSDGAGAAARQGSEARVRPRRDQGDVGPRAEAESTHHRGLRQHRRVPQEVLRGRRESHRRDRRGPGRHSRTQRALRDADDDRSGHPADEGPSGRDALGGGGARSAEGSGEHRTRQARRLHRSSKAIR